MRWLQQNRGFTLVELVIVLAITALLLGGLIAGRGVLFQNSGFTTAMDDAQNSIRQIQNEANQAISPGTGQSAEVVFGRLVELSATAFATPSTIKTWTLIGTKNNSDTVVALAACNEVDQTFQDGVAYNPTGTDPTSTALIFTRGNDVSGNAGQLFVAPSGFTPPIGGVLEGNTVPGEPSADCSPSVAPQPPNTLNLANPCSSGTYNRLTGCLVVAPAPPTDLKAVDQEGATADSQGSTSVTTQYPTLAFTVTLPLAEPGAIVTLYKDGIQQIGVNFNCSGTTTCTATTPYTLGSGNYGVYHFTAEWSYGGSPNSSATAPPITVTYTIPTTCAGSAGFVCGLTGSYYGNSGEGGRAQTTIIDKQVGCDLNGGGCNATGDGPVKRGDPSSYNDFTSTLSLRTSRINVQSTSVNWTGWIYLAPGNQQVCIDSNKASSMKIGVASAIVNNGSSSSPLCGTYDGGSSGAWSSISIDYTSSAKTGDYVRLVEPNGTKLQTETCALTFGLFVDTCDTSPTDSDIAICKVDADGTAYFKSPPPDLPADSSPYFYTCKLDTVTAPAYKDVDGSRLRTLALSGGGGGGPVGLGGQPVPNADVALATLPTLPYDVLVQTIEAQAKTLTVPVADNYVHSALQAIARAIEPGNAEAAGVANCDSNILNPVNYLNAACTNFTNGGTAYKVPISIPGSSPGSTQQGSLILNFSSNTVTWSMP